MRVKNTILRPNIWNESVKLLLDVNWLTKYSKANLLDENIGIEIFICNICKYTRNIDEYAWRCIKNVFDYKKYFGVCFGSFLMNLM
jgi:hypothetical protein